MSNVLLATESEHLQRLVDEASGGSCIAVTGRPLPSEPAALLAQLRHESLPDILVLDASDSPGEALALAARFDRDLPGTGVVLFGDQDALAVDAMRAGVRDIVPMDIDVAGLRAALDRVDVSVRARRSAPMGVQVEGAGAPFAGRVLTVLSPKGGAGKTTLATNLAIGLGAAAPGSVALVDLDVQFGDVATALSLEPEYTLDGIMHGAGMRDPIALKTQLTQHSSGVFVVCAPESPVVADSITPDHVSELLKTLSTQFRYVVIDTAAGLEARTLAALDHTTDPLLVTTFDVPGARGLRKEIATLRELGMLTNARKVLLNFADPKAGLAVADVEATIQSRVDLTIPFSKSVTASLNTGVPLLQQKPRDVVSQQIRKLLDTYVAAPSHREKPRRRAKA